MIDMSQCCTMTRGTAVFALVLLVFVCAQNNVDAHPTNNTINLSLNNEDDKVHIQQIPRPHKHKKHLYFIPFVHPYDSSNYESSASSCNTTSNDDEGFPNFLSDDQILNGGIVLVVLIGVYGFTLLAVVCNDYFLPCVETICERLNLTPDVAAATFMSIATSTPEFFTNIISTFLTQSDVGIGTIVGSSMYNALGVPAIGGLASPWPLQLDWYPLSRDAAIYIVSVGVLIGITWDGYIFWYETLVSLAIYILYFIIMFNNKRIAKFVRKLVKKEEVVVTSKISIKNNSLEIKENKKPEEVDEDVPRMSHISAYGTYMDETSNPNFETEHQKALEAIQEEDKKEAQQSLFRIPEGGIFKKFLFYYLWPLKLILRCTVPNPVLHPDWFPLTFIMCIIWIGANSYVVSWMINLIGSITNLPDALLGMTLMAVGGCLPETVSMTIIARRGEGGFGVSNSLGANTMNVLYSLGLPWLLKTLSTGAHKPIRIQSGTLEYTIMSLVLAVIVLYTTLLISKFRLSKISGSIIGCFYIVLVVVAILTQTIFFKSNC